jgi:hypothetical protein
MKSLKKSISKAHTFTVLVCLSALIIGFIAGFVTQSVRFKPNYDQPQFQAYLKTRKICDGNWGGFHSSLNEAYRDWLQDPGVPC